MAPVIQEECPSMPSFDLRDEGNTRTISLYRKDVPSITSTMQAQYLLIRPVIYPTPTRHLSFNSIQGTTTFLHRHPPVTHLYIHTTHTFTIAMTVFCVA
ncbi:hypothetical protein E2C01_039869 [Portunus trituberculatus]|uniref:Uncharacterized protein n=1 Tax=Portunus trituberculatus TaxID=210409 RepID=A0A5B7FEX5_PORTR|nr:hypothetical protein [Portunus trituberculatus]